MPQPAGHAALITGASRGIGRELAIGLAQRGVSVGLLARDQQRLDAVVAQCRSHDVVAVGVSADVTDRDDVARAVDAVVGSLDRIDLLVNNAGVIEPVERAFLDTDVEDTWRVVEVNVRGPVLVSHAVLPVMLAGGGGRIVNINSGSGYKATQAYTGYGISKGALARLTTLIDAQYRDEGIYAFDVAPGHVRTEMTTAMPMHEGRTTWTPPEAVVEMVAAISAGRLDELAGRYVRAGTDTVESLLDKRTEIVDGGARVLGLIPYGPDDPLP